MDLKERLQSIDPLIIIFINLLSFWVLILNSQQADLILDWFRENRDSFPVDYWVVWVTFMATLSGVIAGLFFFGYRRYWTKLLFSALSICSVIFLNLGLIIILPYLVPGNLVGLLIGSSVSGISFRSMRT